MTLVIGGGPAGAAAACRLAQHGRPVTLVERSRIAHDKICGEFMSIEAQHDLAALGVDPIGLGAVPISQLLLVHRDRATRCRLPFRGLSLSRRVLDEALLARAAALGATVRRGVTVGALQAIEAGVEPREADLRLPGQAIVLASGKHTLRGAARRAWPSGLVGFKMYFAAPDTLPDTVQIHLFDGGYAGLEPVEGDRVNLCLLVDQRRLDRAGNAWSALLASLLAENRHLAESLAGATPLLPRPLTIAGVPYGFVHRPAVDDPANLFRVGDQLAVIPSFCGDGLAIALHSGIAAADAVAAAQPAASHHHRMRRDFLPQMRAARLIAWAGASPLGRRSLPLLAQLAPGLVTAGVRATRVSAGW